MIWRDLFVFAGLLFKSKAPQNLLRASVCGSKLRIRCCVLLYLDLTWARIGRRTLETTSLSPIWPKTGRRILRPDPKQVGDSHSPTCLRRLMHSLLFRFLVRTRTTRCQTSEGTRWGPVAPCVEPLDRQRDEQTHTHKQTNRCTDAQTHRPTPTDRLNS